MRSSIRYSLVAVGALALMVFTFAMLRPRLEPTAQAQRPSQVAGCDATRAPSTGPSVVFPGRSAPNPCLVISKFRENGPSGSTDEFVEIFNASSVAVTVSSLSNDPETIFNGIGVYVGGGQTASPTLNQAKLACQIKGTTRILGRRWFLCAANGIPVGSFNAPATASNSIQFGGAAGAYSLGVLGINSNNSAVISGTPGTAGFGECTNAAGVVCHSTPDATIGGPLFTGGYAGINDIPDDAGIALLDVGTDIVTQCQVSPPGGTGAPGCPSGFSFGSVFGSGQNVVLDKVGFNPYAPGTPANTNAAAYPNNIYANLAAQYCEGNLTPFISSGTGSQLTSHNIGCLQPIGDMSVVTLPFGQPCPPSPSQFTINPLYSTTGSTATPYDTVVNITPGSGVPVTAPSSAQQVQKCYGESGQYAFARRRSGQTFNTSSGEIFKDSWDATAGATTGPPASPGPGLCAQSPAPVVCGNADDFILETPIPASTNLGTDITGVQQVAGVLGVAWPHNCDTIPNGGPSALGGGNTGSAGCQTLSPGGAPPIVGNDQFTQLPFDICSGAVIPCSQGQLQPRNAERRYAQDPTIFGTANDPFGTFILRLRYINNFTSGDVGGTGTGNTGTAGQRWRIDDISTNCGGQGPTTFNVLLNPPGQGIATQEARNVRGADASTAAQTPTPTCQGEGSDTGVFTALLKGVNHYGEIVVDSAGIPRVVAGTVMEDVVYCGTAPCGGPPVGSLGPALQPFGGGSNSTFVVDTTVVAGQTRFVTPLSANILNGGDGVSAGTGSFPFVIPGPGLGTNTFRMAFKFGVVRSGRFKLFLGREVAPLASPGQSATPSPQP